ncbi:MAG: sialate O-acetylesterase [Candidatus Latescibacteria bacterium]|nr:sialate O-acetylesterase [Candidatus Latescibacterota bacterium]
MSLRQLLPSLSGQIHQSLQTGLAEADSAGEPSGEAAEMLARRQISLEQLRAAEADTTELAWAAAQADDGDWSSMDVPGRWEDSDLGPFDGMVWFRRTVDIPDAWAGRDLELHLGPIDEVDVTWFDGAHVGTTGNYTDGVIEFWDDARLYTVPGHLVKAGRRSIAVRAIDGYGWGGLWGSDAEDMFVAPVGGGSADRLALAGPWRSRAGVELTPAPAANQQRPGALYHAMIHPLIPYSVRGAIWYQGESNLWDGAAYADKMEALIGSWRRLWGQPLAFYYAQLAPYRYGSPDRLPLLWEAQTDVMDRVSDTGMAVITDVGSVDDIHPTDKQTVGSRLAGWALARTYGRAIPYSGPRRRGAGGRVHGHRFQ